MVSGVVVVVVVVLVPLLPQLLFEKLNVFVLLQLVLEMFIVLTRGKAVSNGLLLDSVDCWLVNVGDMLCAGGSQWRRVLLVAVFIGMEG